MYEKYQKSIDLLRKAEPIALKYSDKGFFLAFSGGKDSQALYHIAKLAGVKFEAHMNFTSVDPPQVIRFVRENYPDVICHKPIMSIFDRAIERGILPSMRIRWCCSDYKENAGAGRVTLTGIRRQESIRRAKRNEMEVSNHKFSGNAQQFEQWQEEQIEKIKKKMLKKEGKHLGEDFFSLDKDREIRCVGGKDTIIVNPILDWTEADVWLFLNDVVKVPHCVLYDQGYKRIGCILCPMSSYRQKLKEIRDFPHVKRGWIRAIKAIRQGGYSKENIYGGTSGKISPSALPTTDGSNIGELPPPQPYTILSFRRLEKENKNLQREDGPFPKRKHLRIHGHWNRKANMGIWSGVFKQPLYRRQRRGADA